MRHLRVILLVHEDLIPPDSIDGLSDEQIAEFRTEFDVCATLRELGHEVHPVGVGSDLGVIREAYDRLAPDIAFNLLEEFRGVGVYDSHVAAYLEMLGLPYTGCNPRGLMLAHNKAISKMVARHHRVPVPRFAVLPIGRKVRRPARLDYPAIVKSLTEEGSVGIAEASICRSDDQLIERVSYIHRNLKTDAIAEHYIDGREIYVGVIGNHRLTCLPTWELYFDGLRPDAPRIATDRIKWDYDYQDKIKLESGPVRGLPDGLEPRLQRISRRVYRALQLSGYARLDFRLAHDGTPYLLEANPNPQLMYGEDFAESAHAAGIRYEQLLQRILHLGTRYRLIGQA
jgi:D-alanine-D-alanine ligase